MKFIHSFVALSSSISLVDAFPALDARNFDARNLDRRSIENLSEAVKNIQDYVKDQNVFVNPSKPIDITGRHKFQAPSGSDQRGPCPGLNALANHGYISRDGVTSFVEVVTAINQGLLPGTWKRDRTSC